MADRTCVDCGADISHRHGNTRLCATCKPLRQAVQQGAGSRSKPCAIDNSDCATGRLKRGFCERHYRRMAANGHPDRGAALHLRRFEVAGNGCWLWTGPLFSNGYGHISYATFGTTLAHRAFYEAHRGPIPEGLDLDHTCVVRRCVNPAHLEPVTRSVNIHRIHERKMP